MCEAFSAFIIFLELNSDSQRKETKLYGKYNLMALDWFIILRWKFQMLRRPLNFFFKW